MAFSLISAYSDILATILLLIIGGSRFIQVAPGSMDKIAIPATDPGFPRWRRAPKGHHIIWDKTSRNRESTGIIPFHLDF